MTGTSIKCGMVLNNSEGFIENDVFAGSVLMQPVPFGQDARELLIVSRKPCQISKRAR